jgi:hypothetical protein
MADFPLPGPLGYVTSLNNNRFLEINHESTTPNHELLKNCEQRTAASVAKAKAAMFSHVWEHLLYRWEHRLCYTWNIHSLLIQCTLFISDNCIHYGDMVL